MKRKAIPVVVGALIILILVIFAATRLLTDKPDASQETMAGDLPQVGQTIAGFTVEEVQDFPEAKGAIITFRHEISGAQLCYIKNDDTNRAFAIGYRTPMADESDINHVFEHSILASSEKYPSHAVFFDMIGKSYNTFVNAFTLSTLTMYPVASQSEEQLHNMADVVLSCMVSPGVLSNENFFKREALRYTLEDADSPISMSGTVFTEDLSYMTSISDNAINNMLDTLYPGQYASNMIGLAWANYRELTFDKAQQLYDRSYHFDNALLLLYGDLDYDSFLTFLDSEYLSHYPNTHTDLSAYDQPSEQSGYKEVQLASPAFEGDAVQNASVIDYAFDLDGQSYETLHQYAVLCELLNANDSVFQTNLRAAGLGNASAGLLLDQLKPVLRFELSGANPEDAQTFRNVVEDTLTAIRENGLDSALLERALKINRFSQYLTEESSDKAISVYFPSILIQWSATDDTNYYAQEQEALDALAGSEGQTLYRQLADGLLNCTNTALVTTTPQPGLAEQIQAEQEQYLVEMKASMSEEELNQMIQDTQDYDAWAEETVTNSDFVIPVSDLPDPEPQPEIEKVTEKGVTYYTSDVGEEGIAYNKLLLDTSAITQEDLFYLDIYMQMVGSLGTSQHSDTELEALKQEYLNGLWMESYYPTSQAGDNSRPYIRITWINDPADQQTSLELLLEMLQNTQLGDKDSFLQWWDSTVGQWNPGQQDSLTMANRIGNAACGGNREYYTYFMGTEDYDFLSQMRQNLESDPNAMEELQAKIKQISDAVCQRDHMVSMLVTEPDQLKATEAVTRKVLEQLPSRPAEAPEYDLPTFPEKTGVILEDSLCTSMGVVYLEQMDDISGQMFPFLIALQDQYLLPELRYTGQAYSTEFSFSDSMEQIYAYSYADQKAAATVDVFLGMADALDQMELTQEELDGYIINAYSIATMPSTRTQDAIDAMTDDLRGFDVERMYRWKEQIKTTTVEDQQKAVEMLRSVMDEMKMVTTGNSNILNADADYYDKVYDYRRS